ncbi:MAG: hypothetical protein J6U63_01760, partial [Clostridia bacterium]|nr:hypothetical protein [Clostridia bacterium]
YIVGGGAKNGYLNRLTEEATGKRVIALPIEATAIGNLAIQIKNGGMETGVTKKRKRYMQNTGWTRKGRSKH